MQVQILPDDAAVARRGAAFIAEQARAAVRTRGRFMLAVSGGRTPWAMLRALAAEDLPWAQVQLFQVDERVAPAGDAARNLTSIQASLLDHAPLPAANVHAMPVEAADLPAAARDYAATLQRREVGGRWPRSSDSPCRFRVRRSCRPTGKEVYHLRAAVALVDWP